MLTNNTDSKTKIFVDLSKSLVPSNLSSSNNSGNKFHYNSPFANQGLFSNKGFTFNAQNHASNNGSLLTSNESGYYGAIKRISTSPRSTSSYKSSSSYTTTSSYHTTVSGSLSTNTAGSSSNSSASTRSVSSLTSGFTYYTNNSNSSSTIHCDDSNNGSNMSPYSASSCESRNSCSSSSNDEEETAKKGKRKSYCNDSSTDTSSCSTYLLSSDTMSSCTSPTSSHDNSTCTSRTTRTSAKSSSTISPSAKTVENRTSDLNETQNKLKCQWEKCKFVGKSLEKEDLTKHLKEKHINTQRSSLHLKCCWKGCKNYKQPSVSFSWLERHAVDHIDTKPIACIMTGCAKKFRTNTDLEKHVQTHINNSTGTNGSINSPYASPQKTSNKDLLKKTVEAVKLSQMQESQTKEPISVTKTNNKNASVRSKNGLKIEPSEKQLATASALVDSAKLPDCFAHVRKALSKRRKTQTNNSQIKKFKKVQYEDFIDDASAKMIAQNLQQLNYEMGTITFDYNIRAFDRFDGREFMLIEWLPKNIVESEWVENTEIVERIKQMTKISVTELKSLNFVTDKSNPFYNRLRYRPNKRK